MNFNEKVKSFLKNDLNVGEKWKIRKMIVIYWPTASWKTSLSIDIAKLLDSEIISTDSRQIFTWLNIWTWKVTLDETQWIEHHMIDIINPDTEYSVWEFKIEAEKKIDEIYSKWKIPILCGGTWLYIDSLIYDFNIPKIPADDNIRKILENEAEKYWNEYVYNKLVALDPEYAKELHINNVRYVIRALEVKMITWKSKMDFREEKTLKYDILFLTPYDWSREVLYERIDLRVKQMFEQWLIEEVKKLLKIYSKDDFWMKTIWYKEVGKYIESQKNIVQNGVVNETVKWKKWWNLNIWEKEKLWIDLSLEETIELVQKNNRNYAKKQLTWFRKYEPYKNI